MRLIPVRSQSRSVTCDGSRASRRASAALRARCRWTSSGTPRALRRATPPAWSLSPLVSPIRVGRSNRRPSKIPRLATHLAAAAGDVALPDRGDSPRSVRALSFHVDVHAVGAEPHRTAAGRSAQEGGQTRPVRAVVHLPTYNERENLEPAGSPAGRGARPDQRSAGAQWSTTTRRTAPARSPTRWPRSCRGWRCYRPWKEGIGQAYLDAFPRAWPPGALRPRDGLRLLPRSGHLPELIAACEAGADLSHSRSRYVPGGRTVNPGVSSARAISKGGSVYARCLPGRGRPRPAGGRVLPPRVLEAIDLGSVTSDGYAFQIELTLPRAAQGLPRVVEIPITFADREEGGSR